MKKASVAARLLDVALFLIGWTFFKILQCMPVNWAMALARFIGRVGFLLLPGYRAQALAKETGALVYWQNAEDSAARIAADGATMGKVAGMLE